jgi:hypothetical protein
MDIFKNVQNRKFQKSPKKPVLKTTCDENDLKNEKNHEKSVMIKK